MFGDSSYLSWATAFSHRRCLLEAAGCGRIPNAGDRLGTSAVLVPISANIPVHQRTSRRAGRRPSVPENASLHTREVAGIVSGVSAFYE